MGEPVLPGNAIGRCSPGSALDFALSGFRLRGGALLGRPGRLQRLQQPGATSIPQPAEIAMSTSEPSGAPLPVPAQDQQIKVVSHSGLFYWWPVWAVGFLFALLSYLPGYRLAIVPEGTRVRAEGDEYVLTLKHKPSQALESAVKAPTDQEAFPLRVSQDRNYGIVYSVVLLLVIFITNVPLRGLWSVIAILLVLLVTFLLALYDLWGPILDALGRLHIYMTVAGYLFTSSVLFTIWLIVLIFFDQRRWIIFSPGQMRVHQDIGDAVQVYDTTGLTFQKRRSDLFRHWVLGLGSGDLLVSTSGAQSVHIEMLNVLFVGQKVQMIAELMKSRPVVEEKQ